MHLTDCFMELIAYVAYFQKTVASKQPPYDQVKADISRLLDQSESYFRKGKFSQDDYDQARFVVCAWVDEVILSSPWSHKNLWQREQLQRLYLGFHQREVREIYYLCLAQGYRGRFINEGDEHLLDQLKTSNLKFLMGSSVGIPSLERAELFPEAHQTDTQESAGQKRKGGFSFLTLVGLAAPVIIFGVLFYIYRFVLSGIGENILRALP
jgi:type VI secretion system protein ImpK